MHTISKLITHEREVIIARWLEQARRAASTRGLDQPALLDLMPRYLASLAAGEDVGEVVDRHLAVRLRQGFQLAVIVDEFALLGRCILERSLAGPAEIRPDAREIDQLHGRLHRASARVVEMFDAHLREDEQIEKRSLLERLTATIEALHQERSTRDHLVSVLAHDLRGPLSAAKLGAELLGQEPRSPDARRDLALRVDHNLDRLDRMIRDRLDAPSVAPGAPPLPSAI